MEFLFILAVWIAIGVMASGMQRKAKEAKEYKGPCDIHKWTYHPETERLTCTECGFEAGS